MPIFISFYILWFLLVMSNANIIILISYIFIDLIWFFSIILLVIVLKLLH